MRPARVRSSGRTGSSTVASREWLRASRLALRAIKTSPLARRAALRLSGGQIWAGSRQSGGFSRVGARVNAECLPDQPGSGPLRMRAGAKRHLRLLPGSPAQQYIPADLPVRGRCSERMRDIWARRGSRMGQLDVLSANSLALEMRPALSGREFRPSEGPITGRRSGASNGVASWAARDRAQPQRSPS